MNNDLNENDELFVNYYDKLNELILRAKKNIVENINSEIVSIIENYNLESSQNEKVLPSVPWWFHNVEPVMLVF